MPPTWVAITAKDQSGNTQNLSYLNESGSMTGGVPNGPLDPAMVLKDATGTAIGPANPLQVSAGALNFGPVPFALTLGASSYAAGAVMGGLQSLAIFRNLAQPSATISQFAFQWPTGLTFPVTILAFSKQPASTFTDGSVLSLAAADAKYLITGAPLTITPAATPGLTITSAVAAGDWSVKNADTTPALDIYLAVLAGVAIASPPSSAQGSISGLLD